MTVSTRRFFIALLASMSLFAMSLFAIRTVQGADTPNCDPNNGGIKLPADFCAVVVSEGVGSTRHLAVAQNGDIFVSLRGRGAPGGIVGLRDTNGDGKADVTERFGPAAGATGLVLRNGYLYFATPTSIERFKMNPGDLKPSGPAEVVVGGFPSGPNQAGHADKDIAFDGKGNVYVNVGLPSNACQNPDRRPGAPGQDPCPQLEEHGGIWKFDEKTPGQQFSASKRYASGMRQPVALAWHEGHLFVAMNSRDSLDTLFPDKFTAEDNANRPLEPLLQVDEGSVFGWPYCYFDGQSNKMVLAPEYGGDGKTIGRCAQYAAPAATFGAHYAPVALMFYTGTQFPQKYRGGAFLTFHGSWNRSPAPQAGYNITFQPFSGSKPTGKPEVFADGFKGAEPLLNPADALGRPNGAAQGPDGSLYITEGVKGKIWRVFYRGK